MLLVHGRGHSQPLDHARVPELVAEDGHTEHGNASLTRLEDGVHAAVGDEEAE
uniref:Uncharacterized protein n=1 Tax=Steinernema glaseri TaxID=37863 RepID=A0A1I7ZPI7_9BILA